MKRALLVILTLALLAPTRALAQDTNCWFNPSTSRWPDNSSIRVWINRTSFDNIGMNGTGILNALKIAMGRWNEEGGMRIRFRYAGETTDFSTPFGVVVSANATCTSLKASASSNDTPTCNQPNPPLGCDEDSLYDTGTVWIFKSDSNCVPWGEWTDPSTAVGIILHELGHILGRHDAYDLVPGPPVPPNAQCGDDHQTVMDNDWTYDITSFDRTEMTRVYESRKDLAVVRKAYLDSGSSNWNHAGPDYSHKALWRPGPGSSFPAPGSVPFIYSKTTTTPPVSVWRGSFSHTGTESAPVEMTMDFPQRNPVATAVATDGSAIMAYIRTQDDDWEPREWCYETTSNVASWPDAPTCSQYCPGSAHVTRNGIAATYDPLQGRFILALGCDDSYTALVSVRRPSQTSQPLTVDRELVYVYPIESPTVACADTQPIDAPLYRNCRLVWAQSSTWEGTVHWLEFGIGPNYLFFTHNDANGNPKIWQVPTASSGLAPSAAWAYGWFHLALLKDSQKIEYYRLPRVGYPDPNYYNPPINFTFHSNVINSGYLSAPLLTITRSCVIGCTQRLHALWLQYPDPPP